MAALASSLCATQGCTPDSKPVNFASIMLLAAYGALAYRPKPAWCSATHYLNRIESHGISILQRLWGGSVTT